jgi:hypothetical protein
MLYVRYKLCFFSVWINFYPCNVILESLNRLKILEEFDSIAPRKIPVLTYNTCLLSLYNVHNKAVEITVIHSTKS